MLNTQIKSWLMQPNVEVSPELLAMLEKESKAWRTAQLKARKVSLAAEVVKVDTQLATLKSVETPKG